MIWDALTEGVRGVAQAILGVALMATAWLAEIINHVVGWSHEVTVIGGAAITIHGIWRACRHEYRNWQQRRLITQRKSNR